MSIEGESTTDSQDSVTEANKAIAVAEGETVSEETTEETSEELDTEESETSETEGEDESEETEDGDGEEEDTDEDDESEDEAKAKEQEDTEGKKGRKNGLKRRFGKLVQKLDKKDQEIAFLKGQLEARSENSKGDTGQRPEQDGTKKPVPDDFDTLEEYNEAYFDWRLDQQDKKAAETRRQESARSAYSEAVADHAKKVQAFAETVDDYVEVMEEIIEDGFEPSPALEEVIYSSELGPQVFYQLAKDRDQLEKLNKMSLTQVAREVGKIESKLEVKNEKPSKKKTKTSRAPEPMKPTKSSSKSQLSKSIYDNGGEMDFDEWERRRESELARKRA